MAWVWINPRWREALHQQGLARAADLLRLPGVILCGHPDRHVLKVEGGISAYLKKEHHVPFRDRLANAWAGYGFTSKSTREAKTLQAAARAGVACPEVLAHGARGRQAFLLLRERPEMIELRHYLIGHDSEKRALARALGHELARLHAGGFQHGDLYSKHVLAGPGPRFCFLDWQRARKWKRVPTAVRQLDLAMLDATVPDELVSNRARLACLRAYLGKTSGSTWKAWARFVRELSVKLLRKRRVQNLRRLPMAVGAQDLIWLDGERLCVTRSFREELGKRVPEWLRFGSIQKNEAQRRQISLADGRTGDFVQRSTRGFLHRLVSWWRRQPAPEVCRAATIFRLERYRIACPKLLAFGHRAVGWRRDSFLLTEPAPSSATLRDALDPSVPLTKRCLWLRRAGTFLRRLHESGYILGRQAKDASSVGVSHDATDLALTRIDGLERKPEDWPQLAVLDLPALSWLGALSRADKMRFIHGYLRISRLNTEGRTLVRRILARLPREAAR